MGVRQATTTMTTFHNISFASRRWNYEGLFPSKSCTTTPEGVEYRKRLKRDVVAKPPTVGFVFLPNFDVVDGVEDDGSNAARYCLTVNSNYVHAIVVLSDFDFHDKSPN